MQKRLMEGIRRRLFPPPAQVRHSEYSMLLSEDDALSRPTERLMDACLEAITFARKTDLSDVCARLRGRFPYTDSTINLWPGTHYRLIAGFVQLIQPKLVIEIGTAEGISALSLLKYLPPDGKILTFDIVPWRDYPRTCLVDDDFSDGRLEQILGDLGQRQIFDHYSELLSGADFIFIDAAKDGVLERDLLNYFDTLDFVSRPIFFFDDIRLWNMLAIWRELRWPKMDLTGLGGWCGTGVCEPGRMGD